ncbi:Fe(3+)-hydroxamate ABC transporter substrate-binding protein FhuD [Rouxiella badensis]|jgi:ABC-type Fe3+-hydroxamate transport system substrate-binding protein|uniref:Fe(3+)-hydroxamate ABC transporter substrate-binding protein FhuD n=1 Tax=Rouxiella badensis TaxID=1646377 RepID=UPI00036E7DB1|nr:Fe(3+)-hydroxamate ABC transporter substrate-binding protein FhuD [Rouxiella badensis]MCC3704617.1 Fe(3+)-hydroxamate ABC transporter substrate-binding protein FhuD [Rouxiella badensis]MCC3718895.1 Fe(3+)-hydroxamate ABC transporter substrate-binding protein FhuD [Rouxiella badensis]MCC3727766.1 Fe(3+)-hydroxamate ABC transporter substrate-binding protein FhuD [Rouxiella badensis]MCC3733066.1 Fe(3+)-hydroxamate ABC transporter substrate-binding protein FhuD [Rouxiella badensis]MCC3739510.1 
MIDFNNLSRRRLLQAMALAPLMFAFPALSASPNSSKGHTDLDRIIALEWLPVELLIALGVMPMGVADIHNYGLWVKEPQLAPSVIEIGQRTAPNMELMQQMNPSLLVISQGYGPKASQLELIGPVLSVTANDGSGHPLQQAIHSLNKLADFLGLQDRAERHLAQYQQVLTQTRESLKSAAERPVLLFSFLDKRHVLIFGEGSLLQEVMSDVGLTNAWNGERNYWGSVTVGIERLASINNARALCFDHGSEDILAEVAKTPLWQSLPFVRQNQLSVVPAVWFYGATLCAMRFCHILSATLGKPV